VDDPELGLWWLHGVSRGGHVGGLRRDQFNLEAFSLISREYNNGFSYFKNKVAQF